MSTVLSKEELSAFLHCLRKSLQDLDYVSLHNVVFINTDALYDYYSKLTCELSSDYEVSIEEILNMIEAYIPFALTQDTLDYFIRASLSETEDEMVILEKKFNSSAKLDFINVVRNTVKEDDWNYLLSVCEHLRQHRSDEIDIFRNLDSNTYFESLMNLTPGY